MPHYFLLFDAVTYHDAIFPALSASWRRRNFEPCVALCQRLEPAAAAFAERFHTGAGEPLLSVVARGLPFDRDLWRALAGELLWYGAAEIPTVRTVPDTLCCLLAPDHYRDDLPPRERFACIQQAHYGSRDVVFGGYYRPDAAGWNDVEDVRRLADYLGTINPGTWTAAMLQALPELDDEDREDELEARQRFAELQHVYTEAGRQGYVVVCELL